MKDRRQSYRSRTFLGGLIVFNQRTSTLACDVRDLSADGARIAISNTALLPDLFDLTITRKPMSVRARTVWRGIVTAGIVFVQEADVVPLDLARKLKRCEDENKALRQRVAQLSEAPL
jgi:hypothetical protein